MDMEREFRDWLVQRGNPSAAKNYPSAIHNISKHYSEKTGATTNIYTISNQHEISTIAHDYSQSGRFSEFGYEQHSRFRAAIARYSEFFVQHMNRDSLTAPSDVSPDINSSEVLKDTCTNFTYEKDLQTSLCAQISELFPEYQIYDGARGIEYAIGGKRIDVLLEHTNDGQLLAIELKSGLADYRVFGQICMYLGLLKEEFPDKKISGAIVAGSIDPGLKQACSITDMVALKLYRMTLDLEDA